MPELDDRLIKQSGSVPRDWEASKKAKEAVANEEPEPSDDE